MLQKMKMVICRVPRCRYWADKNSHVITIVTSYSYWQHIQNSVISNSRSIFKNLSNTKHDETYWEPLYSQNSLFKHFQAHSAIFSDVQTYWGTLRYTEVYSGIIEPPLPFFEKNYPDFRKKSLDCVHLWVKFSIQNVVLGISWRKNSNVSLWAFFFLRF